MLGWCIGRLRNLFHKEDSPSELLPSKSHAFGPVRKALIATALPLERNAILKHLSKIKEVAHSGTIYFVGEFQTGEQKWEIGVVATGQGNPAAGAETERALRHFEPSIALFVGVAGGIKDVKLGDVVVATKVYLYESGKDEATFKTRPDLHKPSYGLMQRAEVEVTRPTWCRAINTTSPRPRAFAGAIASGEKVIAETKSATFELIRQHYNDAMAVDEEGYGFLEAVYKNVGVHGLVIRGISDLIDKKDIVDAQGWQLIAAENASAFAFKILTKLDERGNFAEIISQGEPSVISVCAEEPPSKMVSEDDQLIGLLKGVSLGDWEAGREAAIKLLKTTAESGRNDLFDALLKYQDCLDDEVKWSALMVVESFAELAPWLIDRSLLIRMAKSKDYSIRSSAAAICMSLAKFAPDRVPTDILLKLAVPDEDYYVDTPATAALKILARYRPAILRIFLMRLADSDPSVRIHAAEALSSISHVEPEILDPLELKKELDKMKTLDDPISKGHLSKALENAEQRARVSPDKYGF
ncbi:MAG: hypothetical protein ACLQT6_02730 [Desulfomonilaceae bacterium]